MKINLGCLKVLCVFIPVPLAHIFTFDKLLV